MKEIIIIEILKILSYIVLFISVMWIIRAITNHDSQLIEVIYILGLILTYAFLQGFVILLDNIIEIRKNFKKL